VDGVVKPSSSYSNYPRWIYKDFAKLGSWHPTTASKKMNGEIAEVKVWNVSLDDKDLIAEEQIMKKKYECAYTQFKWKEGQTQLLTDQRVALKDD